MLRSFVQLIYCAILVLTFFAWQSTSQAETHQYRSEKHGVTLHYPETFEAVEIDHPLVILALRDRIKGFPTFNVITLPGSFDLEQEGPNSPKKQIIAGYNLVGIKNFKFLRDEFVLKARSPHYIASLSYDDSDTKLKSSVALFSGVNEHFFMTFIDREETFEANYPLFSSICKSVVIDRRREVGSPPPTLNPYWYLLPLIILIFSYLLMRRYHCR